MDAGRRFVSDLKGRSRGRTPRIQREPRAAWHKGNVGALALGQKAQPVERANCRHGWASGPTPTGGPPMTGIRYGLTATALGLASSVSIIAMAQAQGVIGNLAKNDSIMIDGR